MSEEGHGPPPLAAVLIVPVLAAIVLTLFAWPQARSEPRDLPLGLAGPPQATAPVEEQLAEADDAFELKRYDDESAARDAIEDRDVYGAIVASPTGPKLLTATGASPAVAQALEENFASEDPAPEVIDVVPAAEHGAALPTSVLPLLIAGIATGVLIAFALPTGPTRIGALLAASLLAGLAGTLIIQSWLEVVDGDWLANAGVLSLTVLSVASMVTGLTSLMGPPGIGVAAVLMVLIGNPWSGVSTAPELLPPPTGDIGQLLPPGAGGQALRSTGFFDGAGVAGHLLVLAFWAALGLVLVWVGSRRKGLAAGEAAASTA